MKNCSAGEIMAYIVRVSQAIGLPKNKETLRVGLQKLEIAISRIEHGLPINDFIGTQQDEIAVVLNAYVAYRDGTRPKENILVDLRAVNEDYMRFCGDYGYSDVEEYIRNTGTLSAEAAMMIRR